MTTYYSKNTDKVKQYQKEYYLLNKDKILRYEKDKYDINSKKRYNHIYYYTKKYNITVNEYKQLEKSLIKIINDCKLIKNNDDELSPILSEEDF